MLSTASSRSSFLGKISRPKLSKPCVHFGHSRRNVWSYFKFEKSSPLTECDTSDPLIQNMSSERQIPTFKKLSPEMFHKNFRLTSKPVIITGIANNWPAATKWVDPNYFVDNYGKVNVPIEVGNNYLDPLWCQKMVTFKDFVKTYITLENKNNVDPETGEAKKVGYLAQHQLFSQIPELAKDFEQPEYCNYEQDKISSVNGWIGPSGTVSPLHKDPYHNILAQVVGYKYIRLYHAESADRLYTFKDPFFKNTSQVDIQNIDYDKFPLTKDLEYLECLLKPGDLLYIPAGCFHFVKSASYSCSVSFWFTGRSKPASDANKLD